MIQNNYSMTLPNFLTMIRILLVPLFVLAFFASPSNEGAWTAVGILMLSGLTDVADGYLARTRHEESILGRILDPLADKLIVLTAFAVLVIDGRIHLRLAMTLLFKEILLLSGGLYFWRRKNTVPHASWLGKGATVTLYLGILLTLLRVPAGSRVVTLGVFVSLLAGFDYLRRVLISP